MSVLADLTQTSGTSTTTLPSWYSAAQQQLLNEGQQAYAAAPSLQQTTAQQAINTLQGANNPFAQAQSTLGTIASGAANPWIVDQATGAVTPNTNTALGGLFAAQNQQLNQLLPNVTAPVQGANIASGQFGSLRGQTAIDKAKADAFAQLATAQNQAALQNQQTGVSAATGLGNVGSQGITSAMNVGQSQMTSPFTGVANLGNVLASLNVPQTVTTTQTPSVLQQIGGLGSSAQGLLNSQIGGKTLSSLIGGGLSGLWNMASGALSGNTDTSPTPEDFGVDSSSPQNFGGFDLPSNSNEDTSGLWANESYD